MNASCWLSHPLVLVGAGGALGSVARYLAVIAIDQRWVTGFPLGTLLVNLAGSCLIGAIAEATDNRSLQLFLMTGILGGFTTFSSFSLQNIQMLEDGRLAAAGLYIGLSAIGCLLGAWAGMGLVRLVAAGPAGAG